MILWHVVSIYVTILIVPRFLSSIFSQLGASHLLSRGQQYSSMIFISVGRCRTVQLLNVNQRLLWLYHCTFVPILLRIQASAPQSHLLLLVQLTSCLIIPSQKI